MTQAVLPTTCRKCGAALPEEAKFCIRCGTRHVLDQRSELDRLREHLDEHYAVTGELGRGGFAVVYLVQDLRDSRYLAVKVLRRELLTSHTAVERFRREIEVVSRLEHPNILPVVFSLDYGDFACYAMPRVRGKTLKEHLRARGQFPILEALGILQPIGAALAHAHARHVVHRDIKPSNVMLDQDGKPLILDFGLARALVPAGGTLTVTGEILGSPQYLAPEQAAGDRGLDHRCDIYNWGLLGYEMLAGRAAFDGASVHEVLYKQLSEPPAPVRTLRPDVPAPLVATLDRALEKDRDRRWQQMNDALAALAAMLPAGHLKHLDRTGRSKL
jgi:serine/threonine-protein kinase